MDPNDLVEGRVLHTLNGAKIGNAIIIEIRRPISAKNTEPVFVVRTDFGNMAVFTAEEIAGLFDISSTVEDHKERLCRQLSLIEAHTGHGL